jgi:hypothetical protein
MREDELESVEALEEEEELGDAKAQDHLGANLKAGSTEV